jgi:thioredoxin reductase (NADPH)
VELTLLARAYCHLCDEMLAALSPLATAHGAVVTVVDVDAPGREALETAWSESVPVLFAGAPEPANELCRYRLDADRVAALLARSPQQRVARRTEIR